MGIGGCFLSKVAFCQRLSSVKDRLQSKVVFHQRPSSVNGRLPSKVVFSQGHLPSKIVFRQRSSFVKGRLPLKVGSNLKALYRSHLTSVRRHITYRICFMARRPFYFIFIYFFPH